jgi:hypothetical protein
MCLCKWQFYDDAGLRLVSGAVGATDIDEADALSWQSDVVDIYCNSWGPDDDGTVVEGPGTLLQMVMETGVREVGQREEVGRNWGIGEVGGPGLSEGRGVGGRFVRGEIGWRGNGEGWSEERRKGRGRDQG